MFLNRTRNQITLNFHVHDSVIKYYTLVIQCAWLIALRDSCKYVASHEIEKGSSFSRQDRNL